jgi:hypothetical protein
LHLTTLPHEAGVHIKLNVRIAPIITRLRQKEKKLKKRRFSAIMIFYSFRGKKSTILKLPRHFSGPKNILHIVSHKFFAYAVVMPQTARLARSKHPVCKNWRKASQRSRRSG